MTTVESQLERLVILDRVTWDTYERLIAEHGERCGTRFTYDEGVLQIMVVSSRHEKPNRILAFPRLKAEVATQFLDERKKLKSTAWLRQVRAWARAQKS